MVTAPDPKRAFASRSGLIDRRGTVVRIAKFDGAGDAGHGMYFVAGGNDRIFLDGNGDNRFRRTGVAAQLRFGSDGLAASWHWETARGRARAELVDRAGHALPIDADDALSPSEGLAVAVRDRGAVLTHCEILPFGAGEGPFGLIGLDGRWVVEPRFARLAPFVDGLAVAALRKGDRLVWGAIDHGGEFAIAPRFERLMSAGGGRLTFGEDGQFGLCDARGVTIAQPIFDAPLVFSEGLAPARTGAGHAGFLDVDGAWAIAPTFACTRGFTRGAGVFSTAHGGRERWGLVDRAGEVIVPPTHHDLRPAGSLFLWAGVYRRTERQTCGYIDEKGAAIWEGTR